MRSSSSKIKSLTEIIAAVAEERSAGRTIVQCHGCFDIVHPGHIRYLEFAKRQGDVLIVSVTADEMFTKRNGQPHIPDALRAENLAALECVDYVTVDHHPTAKEILSEVRPDIYVKGQEYERKADPRFLEEKRVVEGAGGQVIYSSGEVIFSSTELISQRSRQMDITDEKLRLFCQRYNITRRSAESALRGALGLKVLVIGDLIVDRYVFCDASDLASEAPIISLAQLDQREYLGGSAIIAQHIKAMGGEPYLVASIGRDLASYVVAEQLDQMEIRHFMLHNRRRPVSKTRFLVEEQKIVKVDDQAVQPTDTKLEKQIVEHIQSLQDQFDAVIFCDFGYGLLTESLITQLTNYLRDRVTWMTADISGTRGKLMAFRQMDLLTPTEREVRTAMHDYEQGLSPLACTLLDRTKSRYAFITLGRHGMVLFDGSTRYHVGQSASDDDSDVRLRSEHLPTLAGAALDRLGCGDALLAVATMVAASGGGCEMAAYLGSLAAAIEITELGNIAVSYEAMQQALAKRVELNQRTSPAELMQV